MVINVYRVFQARCPVLDVRGGRWGDSGRRLRARFPLPAPVDVKDECRGLRPSECLYAVMNFSADLNCSRCMIVHAACCCFSCESTPGQGNQSQI